jgi:hypothetical protein
MAVRTWGWVWLARMNTAEVEQAITPRRSGRYFLNIVGDAAGEPTESRAGSGSLLAKEGTWSMSCLRDARRS